MQIDFRIFWFWKIAHHVNFEVIETYLHKNIYLLDILGGKIIFFFPNGCKRFSMLHGKLMYNNKRLVIPFTERHLIIVSNIHQEGLGYDIKAKAVASHYLWDSYIKKIPKRFFWANIKGAIKEFIKKCEAERNLKIMKWTLHLISKTELGKEWLNFG